MNFTRFQKLSCAMLLTLTGNILPLWAQQSTAKTNNPEQKRDIRWGKPDNSGLQMGVWQNPENLMAFCLLKNQGAEKVRFSDYYFDWAKPDGVSLLAKPVGKDVAWTKLGDSGFHMSISRGLGPTEKNSITLLPSEEYLTRRYSSNTGAKWSADYTQSSRSISPFQYVWPAEWSGIVEWKIEQEIPNFDSTAKNLWTGTLVSGVLQNDVDEIRRRQLQAFESNLKFQEKIDAQSQTKSEFAQHMKAVIEAFKTAQEKSAP